MGKIKVFLAGRKTYLIGLAAILGAAIAWSQGQMETTQAVEAIIAAILAMTLRAGITKSGQ